MRIAIGFEWRIARTKPRADIYIIDDKAIHFSTWDQTLMEVGRYAR